MNKTIGDNYEKKFIEYISKKGYWCHLFAYKAEGQPCDVVALKNNIPYLIDVKHCDKDRFDFNHIQVNQKNCFKLAYMKGNENCGFAIYFEKQHMWKWLPYFVVELYEREGNHSISHLDCRNCEFVWK